MRVLLYVAFAAAIASAYFGALGELVDRFGMLVLAAGLSLLGTVLGVAVAVASKTRASRIAGVVAAILACPALLAAIYVVSVVAAKGEWIPR